jgi:uridine kinase
MNVVERVAEAASGLLDDGDRVMIAVDGPDAAGKTTFADALRCAAREPVIRASFDDFQHSRAARGRRGALSPEGYYRDAFDHASLRSQLLIPFQDGTPHVCVAQFDYRRDQVALRWAEVPPRAALVVDGVFLQRPELAGMWSLVVYLTVSPETSLLRGIARDSGALGTTARVTERYLHRYLAGQAIYRAEADPDANADIVVDNEDPASPQVLRWSVVDRDRPLRRR